MGSSYVRAATNESSSSSDPANEQLSRDGELLTADLPVPASLD